MTARRIGAALLMVLAVAPVTMGTAEAQVPAEQADYSGYATGSVVHVDALQAGATGPRLVDTDVAFSGASVASQGSDGAIVNETDLVVQPTLTPPSNRSFGRGSGLEVGVGNELPVEENGLILAGKAQAAAPPSTDLVTEEVGPVPADPLVYASLLRGQAQARWNPDNSCILGAPISMGLGFAADASLVNTGEANEDGSMQAPLLAADAPNPERAVSQSRSVTRLVPQTDAQGNKIGEHFGLMTETRMTIAPVTLFKGTPNELTLEFAGEWVLRAVATGVGGAAGNYVFYGPGDVSPETPLVSIIQAGEVSRILTTQDLLGETGLVIPIPGVAEIAIGEDPRMIGGDAASQPELATNGTMASGAVDVVRIKLLEQVDEATGEVTFSAADLRIGHMEVATQVPEGGIRCSLPVSKTANPNPVAPGEQFTYTITVTNPFEDCELRNVRVHDTIAVTPGISYDIVGADPAADAVTGNTLTWNDVGPIPPASSRQLTVTIAVAETSSGGLFTNTAEATGTCGTGSADGLQQIDITLVGRVVLEAPDVVGELPATGGRNDGLLIGLAAAAVALAAATGSRHLARSRSGA